MLRIVHTENGTVRGIEAADPRITAFKGIPFAEPPVGELRFREPQPCSSWEGIRDCYRFAPISMQWTPGGGDGLYDREWHVDPEIAMGEDCLYLNVWTPAKKEDEKLPVLVWYFGGGLQCGYPAEMEFDGERLARRGIIVVTVNYRVNVFGFLSHPELTAAQPEAPANFGHLDQREGLKWVIRNIQSFGGDPKNITIAGQSAGGGSVMSHLTSPGSEGLFQRAIVESGIIQNPYNNSVNPFVRTLSDAEKQGERLFEFLGISTLAQARAMDAKELFSKFCSFGEMMGTVIDHKFSFGDSFSRFMNNQRAMVPVLAGNTVDEFTNSIHADSEADLRKKAAALFPGHEEEFMAIPGVADRDINGNCAQINGIEYAFKGMSLMNESRNAPVNFYSYCFDAEIPGWDNPGNFHSVDLWFFFETLAKCWRPFTGKHYDLARQMANYWTNFVKTGDPNGTDADGSKLPEWVPYTKETPYRMNLSTEGAGMKYCEESKLMQFLLDRLTEKYNV